MKRHALFCFVLCCATGGGCSPIAYDVRADQQLETLTRDIDSRMIAWRIQAEDGAGAIAYDAGFYAAIEAELAELRIRIGAAPGRSNQDIATTLASLGDQIDRLRRLHRQQHARRAIARRRAATAERPACHPHHLPAGAEARRAGPLTPARSPTS